MDDKHFGHAILIKHEPLENIYSLNGIYCDNAMEI